MTRRIRLIKSLLRFHANHTGYIAEKKIVQRSGYSGPTLFGDQSADIRVNLVSNEVMRHLAAKIKNYNTKQNAKIRNSNNRGDGIQFKIEGLQGKDHERRGGSIAELWGD